jgi:hypothetical protein
MTIIHIGELPLLTRIHIWHMKSESNHQPTHLLKPPWSLHLKLWLRNAWMKRLASHSLRVSNVGNRTAQRGWLRDWRWFSYWSLRYVSSTLSLDRQSPLANGLNYRAGRIWLTNRISKIEITIWIIPLMWNSKWVSPLSSLFSNPLILLVPLVLPPFVINHPCSVLMIEPSTRVWRCRCRYPGFRGWKMGNLVQVIGQTWMYR